MDHGHEHRDGQHAGDCHERCDVGHLVERRRDHLGTHHHQDERDTDVEIAKAVQEARQQEEQGAQAEDREDVRRVDDEEVGGDGEDGGHRVDCEDDVGELDDDEDQKERRRIAHSISVGEEAVAVEVVGGAQKAPRDAKGDVVLDLDLVLLLERQLEPGEDEERAEDVDHPVEVRQERRAGEDEDEAHDHRADDAPQEHAVLILPADLEVLEHHEEHEEVVDGQRLLDQVRRDEQHGVIGPVSDLDEDAEKQRQADPAAASNGRFAERDGVGLASEHEGVE